MGGWKADSFVCRYRSLALRRQRPLSADWAESSDIRDALSAVAAGLRADHVRLPLCKPPDYECNQSEWHQQQEEQGSKNDYELREADGTHRAQCIKLLQVMEMWMIILWMIISVLRHAPASQTVNLGREAKPFIQALPRSFIFLMTRPPRSSYTSALADPSSTHGCRANIFCPAIPC